MEFYFLYHNCRVNNIYYINRKIAQLAGIAHIHHNVPAPYFTLALESLSLLNPDIAILTRLPL